MSDQVVGLVGVGTMGSRILRALREEGLAVAAWDVSQAALDEAALSGATPCGGSAEVASLADVVLLSLPGPNEVREVTAGPNGLLYGDPLPRHIVDLSTVGPDTSRELAGLAGQVGVTFVDAPVLGRPGSCGSWTIPFAGPADALAAVAPVLRPLAVRVVAVGPTGAASALKLLNNLMFGAINAITCECMLGAAQMGLDPALFYETIVDSGAATVSNLFRELGPKILAADWAPTFALSLLDKDCGLGAGMLRSVGVDASVAEAVAGLSRRAVLAGLGAQDTAALVKAIRVVDRGGEPIEH